MSNVIVKENETLDSALRRFKRNCAKAGIQQEIRKREHYENQVLDVRKSQKLLESANINNLRMLGYKSYNICYSFFFVSRKTACIG